MTFESVLQAIVLGIVEGLTEYLPVSSTAHLLLGSKLLGFESLNNVFQIMIQPGAILALLFVYTARLWRIAGALGRDKGARRFTAGVVIAVIPAVLLALAIGKYIEALLDYTWVVCVSLIVGGVMLLLIDRIPFRPRYKDVEQFPVVTSFLIGVCQCFALIPGVSRAGATIVGALFLGAERRAAAEFSFFLAMPTLVGAFAYDLYKYHRLITSDQAGLIAIGFVASFFAALLVVRTFLNFVSRHGFALFAYWRIVVGAIGLIAIAVYGTK
jgi:undecaprenyl-diphosphatase